MLYGLLDIGLKAKQLGWWSSKTHATRQMTLFFMCLLVLSGCRPSVESRGSTVPRNAREKAIFDYFSALREQRYEDAYQLRTLNLSPSSPSPKDFLYFKKPIKKTMRLWQLKLPLVRKNGGMEMAPVHTFIPFMLLNQDIPL